MEGLTIFDYKFDDQSLFYSRRIGHAPSLIPETNDSTFVKSPDKTTILSALKFSGTTSNGLSIGIIQSLTANEKAQVSNPEGDITTRQVEPLTSYTVARSRKDIRRQHFRRYDHRSADLSMIRTWNSSKNALTGGLDVLHYWHDKEFYIDTRLIGSNINGSTEAIALQESLSGIISVRCRIPGIYITDTT
jgi:hypothetical protein